MQKVLSHRLWSEVKRYAVKARSRKAAIAYVTRDLIGFRKCDVLVTDASRYTIAGGGTDAKLLQRLDKRGVRVLNCPDLHAKVLLLDDVAVIGSNNMSGYSGSLVEAAVLTDLGSTVAGVASFIEQLVQQAKPLFAADIAELCKIKVARRGGTVSAGRSKPKTKVAALGHQTWLLGVKELVKDPSAAEQVLIHRAMKRIQSRENVPDLEPFWIRWGAKKPFAKNCREGDSIIQIWRSNKAAGPITVCVAAPVLYKQVTEGWVRFYLGEPTVSPAEMSWGRFQRLLKELGYMTPLGKWPQRAIEPDLADAIQRRWKVVAKS